MIVTPSLATRVMTRLRNYLRFHRRKSALTQQELAFLLDYRTHSAVARCEADERRIGLASALVYQLLFDVELNDIFPALYERIQEQLAHRVPVLLERVAQTRPSQRTAVKLELLRKALARLAEGAAKQGV